MNEKRVVSGMLKTIMEDNLLKVSISKHKIKSNYEYDVLNTYSITCVEEDKFNVNNKVE